MQLNVWNSRKIVNLSHFLIKKNTKPKEEPQNPNKESALQPGSEKQLLTWSRQRVKQALKSSQSQLYNSCPHHFLHSSFYTCTLMCPTWQAETSTFSYYPWSSRQKRPGGSNYKFCIAVTEITVVGSWFFCKCWSHTLQLPSWCLWEILMRQKHLYFKKHLCNYSI